MSDPQVSDPRGPPRRFLALRPIVAGPDRGRAGRSERPARGRAGGGRAGEGTRRRGRGACRGGGALQWEGPAPPAPRLCQHGAARDPRALEASPAAVPRAPLSCPSRAGIQDPAAPSKGHAGLPSCILGSRVRGQLSNTEVNFRHSEPGANAGKDSDGPSYAFAPKSPQKLHCRQNKQASKQREPKEEGFPFKTSA